jgi:hypothetical protein
MKDKKKKKKQKEKDEKKKSKSKKKKQKRVVIEPIVEKKPENFFQKLWNGFQNWLNK